MIVLPHIKAGSTSVSIVLWLEVATNTGGGKTGSGYTSLYYWRPGGSPVSVTLSALANITDAWSAGGFKEISATNMPGLYRIDLPDAALAAGAPFVVLSFKPDGPTTQCTPWPWYIPLLAADSNDLLKARAAWTNKTLLDLTADPPKETVRNDADSADLFARTIVSTSVGANRVPV